MGGAVGYMKVIVRTGLKRGGLHTDIENGGTARPAFYSDGAVMLFHDFPADR